MRHVTVCLLAEAPPSKKFEVRNFLSRVQSSSSQQTTKTESLQQFTALRLRGTMESQLTAQEASGGGCGALNADIWFLVFEEVHVVFTLTTEKFSTIENHLTTPLSSPSLKIAVKIIAEA